MKNKRSLLRRLGAFLLAVTLMAGLVWTMPVYADEKALPRTDAAAKTEEGAKTEFLAAVETTTETPTNANEMTVTDEVLDYVAVTFWVYRDGTVEEETKLFYNVQKGTTLAQLGVEFPEVPEYPDLKFESWTDIVGAPVDENTPVMHQGDMIIAATYDKSLVSVVRSYIDKDGYFSNEITVTTMPKDTLINDVITESLKKEAPGDLHPDLTLKGWEYYVIDENATVGNMFSTTMNAQYEESFVRFAVWKNGIGPSGGLSDREACDVIFCKAAEKGEIIEIPKSSEKYGDITWTMGLTEEEKASGKIVVDSNVRSIYGVGSNDGETENTDSSNPEEIPDTPSGEELSQDSIDSITKEIANVVEGESYEVDMDKATVVPNEILESIKGRDVNVSFDMDGYTWTINGKDVKASKLKDINLEVKFNTNVIPESTVKNLAGNNPVQQLSLTHNGNFGFEASLTMNAGEQYAGKYGNLFWYDKDKKMSYIGAGEILSTGEVSLTFSHASDYALVIADHDMGNETSEEAPKTGDSNAMFMWFTLLIASVAAMGAAVYRKRVYHR